MGNRVEYKFPVQAVHGKVGKDSRTYMRTRYGTLSQIYLVELVCAGIFTEGATFYRVGIRMGSEKAFGGGVFI